MNELLKTKSFWNGVGMILFGIYQIAFEKNSEVGLASIALGMQGIFQRHSTVKMTSNIEVKKEVVK